MNFSANTRSSPKLEMCFVGRALEAVATFVVVPDHAHALAAAAGTGFEHHRIADLAGDFDRVIGAVNDVGIAGYRADAGLRWPASWT